MPASPTPRPDLAELVARADELRLGVLARWASTVDRDNRFPAESVAALRAAGLLGYFVPTGLGGLGGDVATYCKVAELLGDGCLSTAMIWVMHAHQTAVLADHRTPAHDPFLQDIAGNGVLLASVTSEYGKGGDVLRAVAPLTPEGGRLRLTRAAPAVSYGGEAGYFLVTMRSAADRPPTDVSLVLVRRADGEIAVTGDWQAMGLRGTRSVPMQFDVVVDRARVVGASFRQVALTSLVPLAQAGWTAAWFGAARGAMQRFLLAQREHRTADLNSDLFLSRMAELRLKLDLVESLLLRVVARLDALRATGVPPSSYEDMGHNILINNLKIAGSRLAFEVADGLIQLAGLGYGYLQGESSGLERTFRDLRSAALMYGNDRLLLANGRLLLVEDRPITGLWDGAAAPG